MASIGVPLTIVQKHKVLFSDPLPAAELSALGDAYADKEIWHEALDFYEGAQNTERIEQVKKAAQADADLVLYLNACRALGAAPDSGELSALKDKAASLGKKATAEWSDTLRATRDADSDGKQGE